MAQDNPRVISIPINAKGGAMTAIALTIGCSKATVIEDPAYNNGVQQGLTGFRIDTNPPQPAVPIPAIGAIPPLADPQYQFTWLPNSNGQSGPAYEPIVFGGDAGRVHGGLGGYVGGQGTVILLVTSNGPNPSGVLLEQSS
jgi:hypothetical protein